MNFRETGCFSPSADDVVYADMQHEFYPLCANIDDEILAWIRSIGSTEFQPCSTCRMGAGEDSITDSEGLVHEVEGLRVVDASTMPNNVTTNLNARVPRTCHSQDRGSCRSRSDPARWC